MHARVREMKRRETSIDALIEFHEVFDFVRMPRRHYLRRVAMAVLLVCASLARPSGKGNGEA